MGEKERWKEKYRENKEIERETEMHIQIVREIDTITHRQRKRI